MDIDLPDLTNRPRPDLRQPHSYTGLPFANPIDAAIPSDPVDVTEQDVAEAEAEGDEEVVPEEEEGLTEAASAPDFEAQEEEEEAPQAENKKRRKKKRKGVRI